MAVLNGTASLPCNIIPPTPSDSVILVVWYRNELKPIYSYDSRDSTSEAAAHWKDKTRLGERAHFRTVQNPAVLAINNVQESDEGQYRCRVDFLKSPTRNSKVFLMIVVPPEKPTILDSDGQLITSVAGPYIEGSDAKLICRVRGGKPAPLIKWWKDDTLLESSEITGTENDVKLREVTVHHLDRIDLNKSLVCQASNNNINAPLSTTVHLDVYFKPFNVTILDSNQPLSANREYKIVCLAVGSRPHATIRWWMNGELLTNFTETISDHSTTSVLTFTPSLKDHNKTLTCQAENPKIAGGITEAISVIDVTFAPVLKLDLGSEFNPDDIEEGDDVYFECKVFANPQVYKIEWLHNDALLQPTTKNILIVNHKTLILQKIKRYMAGNYSCIASSVEGDGKSNTVHLRVMYKPICKPNQKYIYGVAKEENAQVVCEVDAFPPPDDFRWLFNHTTKPIPEARYSAVDNRKGISILTFSPQTELDYGILMCYARNTVGQQREPCIFHIIPAGLPEPPYNCTVNNQTSDSIEIFCKEGFDSGQSQYFISEVIDPDTGVLVTNITSSKLSFKIGRLSPGKSLRMNIYAVNTRGRSDSVILETFTLESAQKHTGNPSSLIMAPILGALLGLTAISSVLGVVTLCALRGRRNGGSQPRYVDANGSISEKTKCISELDGYDVKKTPDVIQCNNKAVEYRAIRIDDKNNLPTDKEGSDTNSKIEFSLTNPPLLQDILSLTNPEADEVPPSSLQICSEKYQNSSTSSTTSIDGCKLIANKSYSSFFENSPTAKYSSMPAECTVTSIAPHHREVITVRTPLPHKDQESCV